MAFIPNRQFFFLLRGLRRFNVPDMPHELTELRLDAVTRPASGSVHEITADVCVVGAGIAGCSAAIESARLGRSVVLVASLPLIGGQMVHSRIGLFAGVFGNAPGYAQLTHGIFDEIFAALEPSGDLYFSRGHTTTVFYNEVALGRWLERTVQSLGIQVITGAVLGAVTADLRQPAVHRGEPARGVQARGRGDRRGVRRAGRGSRAAAAGRARVLLPRARHRGDERDAHRRAARPGFRLAGHVRGAGPGR